MVVEFQMGTKNSMVWVLNMLKNSSIHSPTSSADISHATIIATKNMNFNFIKFANIIIRKKLT